MKIRFALKIVLGLNLMEFLLLLTITGAFIGFGFVSGGWPFWGMAGVLGLICPHYNDSPRYGFPIYPFEDKELSSLVSWSKASILAIIVASLVLSAFCLFQKPSEYGEYYLRFCRQLSYGCFAFGGCFIVGFADKVFWSLLGYSGPQRFIFIEEENPKEELSLAA